MSSQVVSIETIKSLSYTGISASYAAVGTPLSNSARILVFNNGTQADVIFSDNGTDDKIFVPKGEYKTLNLTANRLQNERTYVFPKGTQFYVKQLGSPSSGAVYIESIG